MLRTKKSTLGLVGLALAAPATAMLLVAAPEEANAKGFRFSFSKNHASSHATPAASKHHASGDADGVHAAGADEPAFTFRPRFKRSSGDENADEEAARAAESPDATGEPKAAEAAKAETPAKPAQKAAAKAPDKPKNPIAAAHPGMDVVVCEAGCTNPSETQEAVYMQPTTAADASTISEVKPTATAGAAEGASEGVIRCMGGCYDTPKVYRSALAAPPMAAAPAGASIVPLNAKPNDTGSGAWMRRIDASRAAEPAQK